MRYLFDRQYFEEKQDKLLKFANSKIGRWFFRIHGKRSSIIGKITKIEPNAITWKKGEKFQTEFRTHNKFSKRLYHGLYPVWYLAHIWDTLTTFQPEWNLGFDTLTVYPDANAETDTVDGYAQIASLDVSWATLIADAGGAASDADTTTFFVRIISAGTSNQWRTLTRSIFLFKTSALTAGATISGAVMSLYGTAKADAISITPDINIYSSAPASNTALAAGDFDSLGATAFATAIAYASWSTTGYNDFTLNATGIAAIVKDGISKFGARNANYDVSGSAPGSWVSLDVSSLSGYYADQTGTTSDPKLVVTYTAVTSITLTENIAVSETLSKVGTFIRNFNENLSITETLGKGIIFVKSFTENLYITEILSKTGTFIRAFTENLAISETLTKAVTFIKTLTENISITEILSTTLRQFAQKLQGRMKTEKPQGRIKELKLQGKTKGEKIIGKILHL